MLTPLKNYKNQVSLDMYLKFNYKCYYELPKLNKIILKLPIPIKKKNKNIIFFLIGLSLITNKKSLLVIKDKILYCRVNLKTELEIINFLDKYVFLYLSALSDEDLEKLKKNIKIHHNSVHIFLNSINSSFFDLNSEFMKFSIVDKLNIILLFNRFKGLDLKYFLDSYNILKN